MRTGSGVLRHALGVAAAATLVGGTLAAVVAPPAQAATEPPAGTIVTVAGGSCCGEPGDPATTADLFDVAGVAADAEGSLYVSTGADGRVWRVSNDGVLHAFAGADVPGSGADGEPATATQLGYPDELAVSPAGDMYIADFDVIHRVSDGTIWRFAGGGDETPADGATGTSLTLCLSGIAADASGLVVGDWCSSQVLRISYDGTVTVLAGGGDLEDDGVAATEAAIFWLDDVTVAGDGTVYFSDADRVRRVSGGLVTTVVTADSGGLELATDAANALYLADPDQHLVDRVAPDGTRTRVAGVGAGGTTCDGDQATRARVSHPVALAFDGTGSLYVASDDVVRRVYGAGSGGTGAGGPGAGPTGVPPPVTEPVADTPGTVAFEPHISALPRSIGALSASDAALAYAVERGEYSIAYRQAGSDIEKYVPDEDRVDGFSMAGTSLATAHPDGSWDRVESYGRTDVTTEATSTQEFACNEQAIANTGAGALAAVDVDGGTRLRHLRTDGSVQDLGAMPSGELMGSVGDPQGAAFRVGDTLYYADFGAGTLTAIGTVPEGVAAVGPALGPGTIGWFIGNALHRRSRTSGTESPVVTVPTTPEVLAVTASYSAWWSPGTSGAVLRVRGASAGAPIKTITGLPPTSRWDDPEIAATTASTFAITAGSTIADRGIYTVDAATATFTKTVVAGMADARVRELSLTAGRAVYADNSTSGLSAWVRDIGTSAPVTLGARSLLFDNASHYSLRASGPRVLASIGKFESGTMRVYDGTSLRRTTTLPDGVRSTGISGTRFVATQVSGATRLYDAVTGTYAPVPAHAKLWGRYLAYVGSNGAVMRRDLDAPLAPGVNPRVVRPATPGTSVAREELQIAGDWVLYRAGTRVEVVNALSGVTYRRAADSEDANDFVLSDGALAWSDQGTAHVVNLADGADHVVGNVPGRSIALDDDRIGWVDPDGRARIAPLPFEHALPAKLLSVSSAPFSPDGDGRTDTWRPEFAASKKFAYSLTLKSSGGSVVRTLTGTARYGSARPVWDGKSTGGAAVPDGTYTWVLTGATSDGDGPLVAGDGSATPITGTVVLRRTNPKASVTAPVLASDAGTTLPFTVSWRGSATAAPGYKIIGYDVSYRDGKTGAIRPWLTNTTATSAVFGASGKPIKPVQGHTYYFLVSARDNAGNIGAKSPQRGTVVPLDDRNAALRYSTGWTSNALATRWLGTERSAAAAGSSVTVTSTGSGLRVVGTKCATCGQLRIYADGVLLATVDTYASSSKYRQVLYTRTFSGGLKTRSIKLVVVGTKGRPSVRLDAFGTVV